MYLEFDYAFWFEIHSGRRHYYARPYFCRAETAAAAENNFMEKAASASRPPVLKIVPRRCHLESAPLPVDKRTPETIPLPVDKRMLEAIPLSDSGTTLLSAKTPAGSRKQEAARFPAAVSPAVSEDKQPATFPPTAAISAFASIAAASDQQDTFLPVVPPADQPIADTDYVTAAGQPAINNAVAAGQPVTDKTTAAGQPPVAFIAYFFRYCPACGLGLHDLHTVEITLEQYRVLYEQQSFIVNACRRENFLQLNEELTESADCFSECEFFLNLQLLLTPCQRRRLLLYAAGYTYEEIARSEGCVVSKIYQSIKRARKSLLLHLNDTTGKYF